MSDFLNKYPYTDFHELNLDWVIERVKKLTEDWAATLEEWNSTEEQWQQLYDYVHDYFDNLDVQQEINNKINAMIADGTFVTITTPVIEAKVASMMPGEVSAQLPGVVSNQIGGTVATQLPGVVSNQIGAAVVNPVNDWLNANITQPTTPVVDASLSIRGAAADAEVTGESVENNIIPELTWIQGTIGSTGYPVKSTAVNRYFSQAFKVACNTKITIRGNAAVYSKTFELFKFNDDGTFISKTTQVQASNSSDVIITADANYIYRICFYLTSEGPLTPSFITEFKNDIFYNAVRYDHTMLNYLDLVYDINSADIRQGYLKTDGTSDQTDPKWRYVVRECTAGDIYIYNGTVTNQTYPAIFYDGNANMIGYSDEHAGIKTWRNHKIEIPADARYVGFSSFIYDGNDPFAIYLITPDQMQIIPELTDIFAYTDQLSGKKLAITGDSVATPDFGHWAAPVSFAFDFLNPRSQLAVGGSCMTDGVDPDINSINSDVRIALIPADTDILLANGGANDWSHNVTIGTMDDIDDPTTFVGAVNVFIQKVMARCSNVRIICMSTNYVNFKNRFIVEPNIGIKNDNGDTIDDFNQAYRMVCKFNSVEFINVYELCGINQYNYTTYLQQDVHDYGYGYVHPNVAGGKKIFDVIYNYLKYGKNS